MEDAIPERLPQARLTATVGSSGLRENRKSKTRSHLVKNDRMSTNRVDYQNVVVLTFESASKISKPHRQKSLSLY